MVNLKRFRRCSVAFFVCGHLLLGGFVIYSLFPSIINIKILIKTEILRRISNLKKNKLIEEIQKIYCSKKKTPSFKNKRFLNSKKRVVAIIEIDFFFEIQGRRAVCQEISLLCVKTLCHRFRGDKR